MTPIQQLMHQMVHGDSSLVLDLPSEPDTTTLQSSFLTVALNIIGQTGRAMAVIEDGELVHCALFAPQSGLVLDSTGIRPATDFQSAWFVRRAGMASIQDLTIAELEVICPPESGFFARALSSFEKVVVKHFKSNELPAIVGFQVKNEDGYHWGGRPSFEILSQDIAHHDLVTARFAQPEKKWVMITVLEGDIQDPKFA